MQAQYFTEPEIKLLITRFESGTLPKSEWTHAAHLLAAIWYCHKYDADTSLQMVRKLIREHNESVGTPNTDSGGYHETITRFWLWAARSFLESGNGRPLTDLINEFIHSPTGDRNLPLSFYSKDLLFSKEARLGWIEPDIRPMQSIGS